jgi:hypothetical protein
MTRVKRITNQNKLVEQKVNYFLDRITHTNSYAGWHWHLELETPSSLVEKILFRLESDKEVRLFYLDNYFKHPFFATDNFWNKYPSFLNVKKVITCYNQLDKSKKQEKMKLIGTAAFQNDLKSLARELHYKMHSDLMDAVLNNVLCGHSLYEVVTGSKDTHVY